jgi:hypothetical protein
VPYRVITFPRSLLRRNFDRRRTVTASLSHRLLLFGNTNRPASKKAYSSTLYNIRSANQLRIRGLTPHFQSQIATSQSEIRHAATHLD